MLKPLIYETHSHTPLCKHADGEPDEYAAVAESRNLRGLFITCHNPMPDGFSANVRMEMDEFETYLRLVERTRQDWSGRVDVRLGIEADYFPGYESWLESQLASAPFHYVIGSVHPQIREFRERFQTDDPFENQRTYFRLLGDAAETGLFDCISHPDLIKNQAVREWDTDRIMPAIEATLDRVAATGVAMELNTSGTRKRIAEMNPFPGMLKAMSDRDIPVVLGGDAHQPERVGDQFSEALDLLEQCGFQRVSYFLERQRQEVLIVDARRSLVTADDASTTGD